MMKKYGSPEQVFDVIRGEDLKIVNEHLQKTGKKAVSQMTDKEKKALLADLPKPVVKKTKETEEEKVQEEE